MTMHEDGNMPKDLEPSIFDSQKRREEFIKRNQGEWRIKGKQYCYARRLMDISVYKLAQYLGLSPSVISAFEKGEPVSRSKFVEGAYRAVLTSFFYSYYYSEHKYYPQNSIPIFKLEELIANLCHNHKISLRALSELVETFNFKVKFQEVGSITILDEFGKLLFSVQLKEGI